MRLLKMTGIGNDYVYADCMRERIDDPAALAVRVSDRHFGVGADGLIMICPSDNADCAMIMYNNDGSEGRMCGNGIRCVGKYIYDNGYVVRPRVSIETKSGIKHLDLTIENGICTGARVDMGVPLFTAREIPALLAAPDADTGSVRITAGGREFDAVLVNIGNPHCVLFVDDADNTDPALLGPEIERLPIFPERINVEFVTVNDPGSMRMRVWERGTGITMACGTGATASAAAAIRRGLCGKRVTVKLDGGELVIDWEGEGKHAFMTGAATYVFDIKGYDVSGSGAANSAAALTAVPVSAAADSRQ
ncbi:MAG: diaminopimelate epimerase [Clostridia bacterium]|nr:diaminopimelate epimerase [Clostridia bacterium]